MADVSLKTPAGSGPWKNEHKKAKKIIGRILRRMTDCDNEKNQYSKECQKKYRILDKSVDLGRTFVWENLFTNPPEGL